MVFKVSQRSLRLFLSINIEYASIFLLVHTLHSGKTAQSKQIMPCPHEICILIDVQINKIIFDSENHTEGNPQVMRQSNEGDLTIFYGVQNT